MPSYWMLTEFASVTIKTMEMIEQISFLDIENSLFMQNQNICEGSGKSQNFISQFVSDNLLLLNSF